MTCCAPSTWIDRRIGDSSENIVLDKLLKDLCNEDIVLLGEGARHGEGRTVKFKTRILTGLVETCGFNAVFVESGVYDMTAYTQAHNPSRDQLANAIGGLWSNAQQSQEWITYLHESARSGRLHIVGLDDQLSATSFYAQKRLATDLTAYLNPSDRAECRARISHHINWKYSSDLPYTRGVQTLLDECLQKIEHTIPQTDPFQGPSDEANALFAENLRRLISRNFLNDQTARFNVRDLSMFHNLVWHRSRLPEDTKIIVWSANVHVAKTLADVPGWEARIPLGAHLKSNFDADISAIGFTAYSGSYLNISSNQEQELAAPPQRSLEALIRDADDSVLYLTSKELEATGAIASRVITTEFIASEWQNLFDGLVIFDMQKAYQPIE